MARYLAGDEKAFADLHAALAPRVRRSLRCAIRDETRIEDLLQQTFLAIHASRRRFSRSAPLGPWVMTIAQRLVLNELRRERAERRALGALAQAAENPFRRTAVLDDLVDAKDLARRVGDKLDGLSAPHRRAFQLVRQEGMSVAEASQELGLSTVAVRALVHRASTALQERANAASSHTDNNLARRRGQGPRHALNTESAAPHVFVSITVNANHSLEVSP
jgi:RNA polymerase sigma-70 factor (ECF subfamily)